MKGLTYKNIKIPVQNVFVLILRYLFQVYHSVGFAYLKWEKK